MDPNLEHEFMRFVESRINEADCDFNNDDVEQCCRVSYIQGFRDAIKIMSLS